MGSSPVWIPCYQANTGHHRLLDSDGNYQVVPTHHGKFVLMQWQLDGPKAITLLGKPLAVHDAGPMQKIDARHFSCTNLSLNFGFQASLSITASSVSTPASPGPTMNDHLAMDPNSHENHLPSGDHTQIPTVPGRMLHR